MANGNFFRRTRQITLLILMAMLAAGTHLARQRATSWESSLWVSIYPIAGDDSHATRAHIADLSDERFDDIEEFMQREASRFGTGVSAPVRVDLGLPIDSLPPAPPESGGLPAIAWWSLKLRWWANRATADQPGATPDIRLFAIYHDPDLTPAVPHSLGLKEGRLGIVHVFADRRQRGSNQVVMAHEMLHTLGASDKYAPASNLPAWPDGFAEPERSPRYPQALAEIMAGRIPVSASSATIPRHLDQVVVGRATAAELNWLAH